MLNKAKLLGLACQNRLVRIHTGDLLNLHNDLEDRRYNTIASYVAA